MKKLRVTVDGKSYDVVVEILDAGTAPAAVAAPGAPAPAPAPVRLTEAAAPAPAPVAAPAATTAPRSGGGPGDVASPLAGKVVSIDVTVGQVVAEGAQVATIEAMKMNTYIFAPKAGKVTAVLVTPGNGVEEGMILLQIG